MIASLSSSLRVRSVWVSDASVLSWPAKRLKIEKNRSQNKVYIMLHNIEKFVAAAPSRDNFDISSHLAEGLRNYPSRARPSTSLNVPSSENLSRFASDDWVLRH